MELKKIEDYLEKGNLELLSDFKWGVQGQNDFGQFMNLVRQYFEQYQLRLKDCAETIEKQERKIERLKTLIK